MLRPTRCPGLRLGDMFAFANAVATMTNGATSIVDPTGHVVGYSTIPGQPIDTLRRESTLTLQERTVPSLDADYKVVYSLNTAVFVEPHDDEGGASGDRGPRGRGVAGIDLGHRSR